MAGELERALTMALSTRRTQQCNCTVPGMTGPVHLLLRLQPVTLGEARVVVLAHDVTTLMRESAQRKAMADTLNLLEEAVVDLSPCGDLLDTSPAWARLRGMDSRLLAGEIGKSLHTWIFFRKTLPRGGGTAEVVCERGCHAYPFPAGTSLR